MPAAVNIRLRGNDARAWSKGAGVALAHVLHRGTDHADSV